MSAYLNIAITYFMIQFIGAYIHGAYYVKYKLNTRYAMNVILNTCGLVRKYSTTIWIYYQLDFYMQ